MSRRKKTPDLPDPSPTRKGRRKNLFRLLLGLLAIVGLLVLLQLVGVKVARESSETEVQPTTGTTRKGGAIDEEQQTLITRLATAMADEASLSQAEKENLSRRLELNKGEIDLYRLLARQEYPDKSPSVKEWERIIRLCRPAFQQLKKMVGDIVLLPPERVEERDFQRMLQNEQQRQRFLEQFAMESGLNSNELQDKLQRPASDRMHSWAILLL